MTFFGTGGPPSPFDQFLAQFFGGAVPERRPYSVDIMRLMSDQARVLIANAAARAAEWRNDSLDTEHLLWAATQTPGSRVRVKIADEDRLQFEPVG